ncbi:16S rRNA (guanine(527)-N(7))-methyltransferase RsmG [Bifidobacterium sp.]|uniref:16S rRNA (guanine(527)-N(7))-methyltransferase RsmG n=1 Tax=Bifidobacterium sp. TaxID=41200 RepID=UPI0039ED470D
MTSEPFSTEPMSQGTSANSEIDQLDDSAIPEEILGSAYPQMQEFHRLLQEEGLLRGLIGPRDVSIIWERHILNSAAVVPFITKHLESHHGSGRIADIGSGGGFPGIVIAAMLPDAPITLIEPMERRVEWLEMVKHELHLRNVTVLRARAEEAFPNSRNDGAASHHSRKAIHRTENTVADAERRSSGFLDGHSDAYAGNDGKQSVLSNTVSTTIQPCSIVTCRAVAPLHRLVGWTLPFLEHSGQLIALKGKSAQVEIDKAAKNIKRLKGKNPRVVEAEVGGGLQATHVVLIDKI